MVVTVRCVPFAVSYYSAIHSNTKVQLQVRTRKFINSKKVNRNRVTTKTYVFNTSKLFNNISSFVIEVNLCDCVLEFILQGTLRNLQLSEYNSSIPALRSINSSVCLNEVPQHGETTKRQKPHRAGELTSGKKIRGTYVI